MTFQSKIDRENAKDTVFGSMMPNVRAIERCINRGMTAAKAIDYVCGAGSYAKFAREVYNNIRARSA